MSFPVIKRTTSEQSLIRIRAISCILAFDLRWRRPRKYFKVLYCTVKFQTPFRRFYFRTIFLSEIKIVQTFFASNVRESRVLETYPISPLKITNVMFRFDATVSCWDPGVNWPFSSSLCLCFKTSPSEKPFI